ncbi:hypothetical protein BKH46_07030 [Helicobacter sp. 12S02634-8]|uniref:recombination protein RecO n=1 Tax=Helicobacter sp. 12S02634-8 TaxID=1476199 RepID=UPI000BA7CCB3|nr:recombination protein RecO [Helicobacter sp. 12S02634-8]PAF46496.1 hypothetical protein BKH46_07030 [Helicobacter sp. 12S02634-8]
MQGYILNTAPVKNEDLIVHILTPVSIKRLYRFYGSRHSIVHRGKKIDFEEEGNGLFLPKLRNVVHLGFAWEKSLDRVYVWQRFIGLLHKHLWEVYALDSFYFEMLQKGGEKMHRQNPLRVGLEMYAELLGFEGRAEHTSPYIQGERYQSIGIDTPSAKNESERGGETCFVCGERLGARISLGRAFLFAHPYCIGGRVFVKDMILEFLALKSALHVPDGEVEGLWEVLIKGF